MTVATVRAAIGTTLATISSIKSVNNQVPDAVGKLPATIADLEDIEPLTMGGEMIQSWRLLLLVAERTSKAAHDVLDPYIAESGTDSIKATLEAASIGDEVMVELTENMGHIEYRNTTFVGAEFVQLLTITTSTTESSHRP